MKSNNWMLVLLLLSGAAGAADQIAPKFTDVARNEDGTVRFMNQIDAEKYCRSQGKRLPTARELALYAQSQGAQGISETPKDGYVLVTGLDSSGHEDDFYFNNTGYQPPTGDLGKYYFWSSSIHAVRIRTAYALFGFKGRMDDDTYDVPGYIGFFGYGTAVCLQSR